MMARLLRRCRLLLRRVVLLLALIASLGAPAFAASVTGSPKMTALPPCHEARAVAAAGSLLAMADTSGIDAPMAGHHGAGTDAERAPHAGGGHALPLCCATACVIALPPPAVLTPPGAKLRPLWDNAPGLALNGRAPGIPVPPPRVS